jgi:hypothetical protein
MLGTMATDKLLGQNLDTTYSTSTKESLALFLARKDDI